MSPVYNWAQSYYKTSLITTITYKTRKKTPFYLILVFFVNHLKFVNTVSVTRGLTKKTFSTRKPLFRTLPSVTFFTHTRARPDRKLKAYN